ncbi:MAG: TolC family protein [Sandarakinorhabdus sp.]|nr:TolC family protein [Sandarakinorhabdus sp.]
MRPGVVLGWALLLGGCVAYRPQPIDVAGAVVQRQAAQLDPAAVGRRLSVLAPGAAWNGKDWDLLALFAAAIDNNPEIKSARAAVVTAQADARATRVRTGPTLTLTTEYAGAAPEKSPWLFGAVLDVPIDAGGPRAAPLARADLGGVAARQDLAETVWRVRMVLRRAAADRLIAERQAALFDTIIAVRDRQFAAMQRRVGAGAASRADLERVRADAADAVRRRGDAGVQRAAADAALAAALGVPASAVTGLALRWDGFDAPPTAFVSAGAGERAAAIAVRADVLKSVIAYDQSEADLRGEIARQYPAISIGPGYTWERGLVKLPVNIALVLPPIDDNRAAINAAEARRAEAARRLEASVAQAQGHIDRALVDVGQARALLAKVRSGEIAAADRLAVQADRELAAGSIDRTEWAAAQAGSGLARASEIDALARVHAADAGLEDALRRAVAGPETQIVRAGEAK